MPRALQICRSFCGKAVDAQGVRVHQHEHMRVLAVRKDLEKLAQARRGIPVMRPAREDPVRKIMRPALEADAPTM